MTCRRVRNAVLLHGKEKSCFFASHKNNFTFFDEICGVANLIDNIAIDFSTSNP
jgi:hypothetical protein